MKSTLVICVLFLLFSVNSVCLASTELVQEFELATFDSYLQEKSFWDELEYGAELKTVYTSGLELALVGRISLVKWRYVRLLSATVKFLVSWREKKAAGQVCLELASISMGSYFEFDLTPLEFCGEAEIGLYRVKFERNAKVFGYRLYSEQLDIDVLKLLNLLRLKMWWGK